MKKSKNPKVQELLEDMLCTNFDKYEIVMKLREITFALNSKVEERVMYGGIMFSIKEDFGGVFVSKKHVSYEFTSGVHFEDEEGVLEGVGKFRRHLKLKSIDDIESKKVKYFVEQAFLY